MAKESIQINPCPNCGSEKTNKVTTTNSYCMECGIEFNTNREVFEILVNGCLRKIA